MTQRAGPACGVGTVPSTNSPTEVEAEAEAETLEGELWSFAVLKTSPLPFPLEIQQH